MKKIIAIITTFILTLFLVFTYLPTTALAADVTISSDGEYDISTYGSGSVITIEAGLTVTLTNTSGSTYSNLKIVCEGAGTSLTIDGVKINDSSNSNTCALAFNGTGNTLTLVGSSTLKSGYSEPGIRVESGTELEISGDGSLEVTGGEQGAGIGGGGASGGGTITISGGTVTATGGVSAAGIGGGYTGDSGIITISGGTVTAHSGIKAAGIGGGEDGNCNEILITGGTVNAYSYFYSESSGAAIGGGRSGGSTGSGGKITITGGTVTACANLGYDNRLGAGIGCGHDGSDAEILITGGTVNASSEGTGAGIGGSEYSENVSVTISGGTVIAEGGTGIGSGPNGDNCTVTINGDAQVTATGDLTGIGVLYSATGCTVTIGGSAHVTATGSSEAGIGGYSAGADVTIIGGTVFASGGVMDIGHGSDGTDEGTLALSGDSSVFFNNDTFPSVLTYATESFFYIYMTTADSNGEIHGHELPTGWTEASGFVRGAILKYATSVSLNYSSKSLFLGDVTTLTATVSPTDATNTSVTWESSDTSVATVSSAGVVEAVGTGTATITATVDGESDTCAVTVSYKSVTSVTLSSTSISMYLGDTEALTATVLPSDAANPAVTWSSSDTSVATVSSAGVVKAVGTGTATITAEADGESDTCSVTVSYKSVTSVTLSDTSVSMYLGDTEALIATVLPTDAANPAVTWTSSNTSVATVTSGVVKAVGEGACTITATADGVSDTCSVYVGRVAVTSVDLSYSTLSMYVDDQRILTADVSPSDATNPDVTWASSDESVATVNSNGVVTAVSVGTATITATADGVSDSCSVTVNDEPDVDVEEVDFIIENSSVTVMYVGDTLQLSVAVTPSDATDTSVTWASSDTSVITVSSSGKVTAVAVGDATITVTAQGNISASYKITVKEDESETEDEDDEEETETLVIPTETAGATAEPEVIIQYEETDVYLTFDLDVSNLAEGAKYIQLPNDEIIDIEGKDVVSISILTSDLDNGSLEIVTLDEDMVPLGSVTLSAGVVAESNDEDSGLPWFTVIMLIFGVAVTSIGGTLLFVRVVVSKK